MASQTPTPPPSVPPSPTDNAMVGRIKRLVLTPAAEWDRIAAEPMTEQGILTGWVAPLAAIGPIAGLIGGQLFPARALGMTIKPALSSALAFAVMSWLLTIGMTYLLALIIDALAPTFGATKNRLAALKVAAFSSTPGWVAGIFGLIPALGIVILLASLYGLYLLWVGLPKLMKAPGDKLIGYIATTIVAAIVLFLIVGAVAAAVMPSPAIPSITISG